MPRTSDLLTEKTLQDMQRTEMPRDGGADSLYETADDRLRERGEQEGRVMERSLYTMASLHPLVTTAVTAGLAYGISSLMRRSESGTMPEEPINRPN
ncbi:MAG: hypothetical protein J5J00_04475 [Deltaproteobacteria bacterium]|nr:hypothetical protein [Deltaproteobacteria bacterium]